MPKESFKASYRNGVTATTSNGSTMKESHDNSRFRERLTKYERLFNQHTEFFVRENPEVVFEHIVNLLKEDINDNISDFNSDDVA